MCGTVRIARLEVAPSERVFYFFSHLIISQIISTVNSTKFQSHLHLMDFVEYPLGPLSIRECILH